MLYIGTPAACSGGCGMARNGSTIGGGRIVLTGCAGAFIGVCFQSLMTCLSNLPASTNI